jgi:hypothetical protein
MMNILMINFRLSCSLHTFKQNKPHIYIKNKSMPLLLNGVRPFIDSRGATKNIKYKTIIKQQKIYFSTKFLPPVVRSPTGLRIRNVARRGHLRRKP